MLSQGPPPTHLVWALKAPSSPAPWLAGLSTVLAVRVACGFPGMCGWPLVALLLWFPRVAGSPCQHCLTQSW